MSFWKSLGKVAQAAVPVAIGIAMPESIINTAVMGGVKHGTPINNQQIPLVNLVLSTGISYLTHATSSGDWVGSIIPAIQHGGMMTAGSTAIHQSLKIPMAASITKTEGRFTSNGKFSL